jgi:flagellar hook protein FlgE
MSFQQGLSGLSAASKSLDVIGNNVANANTVGFKLSQAEFADVFANSLASSGGTQVGIGTTLRAVAQQFTQGNITTTNNPLDLAINGKGFYRLSDDGAISYTRNGQFQMDKEGYVVNAEGLHLTGYAATDGVLDTSAPGDLKLSSSDFAPRATETVSAVLNLDATQDVPEVGTFDAQDPLSYNCSTSVAVFDSLGTTHTLSLYFAKSVTANAWDVYANDGTTDAVTGAANVPKVGTLQFDADGTLPAGTGKLAGRTMTVASGAHDIGYTLDFGGTTQFGSPFGVNSLSQDGYTSGRLSGMSVDADGTIQGRYTNGQSSVLGQVTLANFNNPESLAPLGNNGWAETASSGPPLIGAPGSGTLGALQSAAVEDSNVDLTQELVNMITAQRVYQANAQTIKTQDAVLQTLVNLR